MNVYIELLDRINAMERIVNSYCDRLKREQLRNIDDYATYRAKADYQNSLKELCRLRQQKCQLDLMPVNGDGITDEELFGLSKMPNRMLVMWNDGHLIIPQAGYAPICKEYTRTDTIPSRAQVAREFMDAARSRQCWRVDSRLGSFNVVVDEVLKEWEEADKCR